MHQRGLNRWRVRVPHRTQSCIREMRARTRSRSPMFAPAQYEPQQQMLVPQLTGPQLPFAQQGMPMLQQGSPLMYMPVQHVSPQGYYPHGMPMLAPTNSATPWPGHHMSNVPPQYSQLPPGTAHGAAPELANPAQMALRRPQIQSWPAGPSSAAPAEVPWRTRMTSRQESCDYSRNTRQSDSDSGSLEPPPKRRSLKTDGKTKAQPLPRQEQFVESSNKKDFGG